MIESPPRYVLIGRCLNIPNHEAYQPSNEVFLRSEWELGDLVEGPFEDWSQDYQNHLGEFCEKYSDDHKQTAEVKAERIAYNLWENNAGNGTVIILEND